MLTRASGRSSGQKQRGKAVSPFGHHAPNLLAIPSLAKGIPGTIEQDQYGTRWATIALLWMDAGYIEETDQGSPRELIQTAVARWMEKQVEGNRQLANFAVQVMPYPSDTGFGPGDHMGYGNEQEWADKWYLGIIGGYEAPWVQLERRITELEQIHPGLGKTAVHWFDMAASRLLPIFTPHVGRYIAERVWWYGTDNQEDYESEMESYREGSGEEDDGDEEEEDSFGPDSFEKCFPDWLLKPGKEPQWMLDAAQLQHIVLKGETEDVRSIAGIVLALSQADSNSYRLPYVYGASPVQLDNVYHLAYVRWNADDRLIQLVDDFMEEANQCSDCFTELLGADCVPLDESGFQKWKTEMEAGFAVLKQLDALLPLISDPE